MEPADLLSDLLASASILSDMASAQGLVPFTLELSMASMWVCCGI